MKHPDGINIASNQSKCKRKRPKEDEKVFRWIEAGPDASRISGAGETVPADANPAAGREGGVPETDSFLCFLGRGIDFFSL